MALTSEATTLWFGDLHEGSGTTSLDSSDAAEFPMTWLARSEGLVGHTNPEELLGASRSACYSMTLSGALGRAGQGITGSHLLVSAKVPGITEDEFERIAEEAKDRCWVSKALSGIPITLEASLA